MQPADDPGMPANLLGTIEKTGQSSMVYDALRYALTVVMVSLDPSDPLLCMMLN